MEFNFDFLAGVVHLTGYTPECPTEVKDVDSPEVVPQTLSESKDLAIDFQEGMIIVRFLHSGSVNFISEGV